MIEKLYFVTTDGIGRIIKDIIYIMDEETYQHYINYHLLNSEREDIIDYSNHILSIIKKQ